MLNTTDFYLAAYLLSKGHKLEEHSREDNQTTFSFIHNESLAKDWGQYYSLKGTVEPMSYGSAIKTLKGVVHSYSTNNSYSNSRGKQNVTQLKGGI